MSPTAHHASILLAFATLIMLGGCGEDRPPLAPLGHTGQLPGDADPARGRRLISEHGCIACHVVPGVRGPASRVGPRLDNVAGQAYLSGVLPNTPENLVRWLMDPPAINPRTAMPDTGLRTADAEDIAAFLLSLP